MSSSVSRRRSILIAPASDPRKARKALRSSADEVVLDLEDAVAPAQKLVARSTAIDLIAEHAHDRTVSVRINAPGTPWYSDDLNELASCGTLASIIVPKVESGAVVAEVERVLLGRAQVRIQALLETPDGILNAREISHASPLMQAVIIGYADLGAALGRAPGNGQAWSGIQDLVLLAARSAGIQAIDGPHLSIADDAVFGQAVRRASEVGFDGKWVIHPAQIDTVTSVFTPSEEQVSHARRVIDSLERAASSGAGAVQLDGQMLDEAVAVAARRVLDRVGAL